MDFYGATNLLPGPNSTELAIHLGYERGGILGLILRGVSFILPAMLSVIILAIIYGRYGELPEISGISYGIKPVVIAIILQALIRLTKSVLKNIPIIVISIIVLVLSFLGLHEILLLSSAGIIIILVGALNRLIPKLRESTWFGGFLDGLNGASLALMALVNWKLGVSAIIDVPTAILAGVSLLLVFRFKINSAWLILGGGLIGYLLTLLPGI